jgi:small-conductance mechanosensitive channel
MNFFRRAVSLALLHLVCISYSAYAFIDFGSVLGGVTGGEGGVGLLVSDIEFRKKELKDVKSERETLLKRMREALKSITNSLSLVDEEIKKAQEAIKSASGGLEEQLKKKILVLGERKQNLINMQDLWKGIDGETKRHVELIQDIIKYLSEKTESRERMFYSLKDLDEVKNSINRLRTELATESSKRDKLQKSKSSEKANIDLLKKSVDARTEDRKKTEEEYKGLSEQEEIFAQELRAKIEIIEQEIALAREKVEASSLKIEHFGYQDRLKEDKIFLLKQKLQQQTAMLLLIQKGLRIEASDVEFAKKESDEEQKKANIKKGVLSKKRSSLKLRRDALDKSISIIERQLGQVKEAGKEKSVDWYLFESRLLMIKNEKDAIDAELEFLQTRQEYADVLVRIKEARARIIEILHDLRISTENLEEVLTKFREEKRTAEHSRKVLRDKQDEIISLISTINLAKEALQKKQSEMKQEREKLFARRGREYFEGMSNLGRASDALTSQKFITERHISQISDLRLRQEDVINQYNFIINYLESQWAVGIWKRSPRAISIKQVGGAVLEVEAFFKKLFWDTPKFLGPTGLFNAIKDLRFIDYIGIFLFLLFYILFFLFLRFFLLFVYRNAREWSQNIKQRLLRALITGIEYFCAFFLKHFLLLFTWLFFFVHVVFRLEYFSPLGNTYIVALFYLATIPTLMYISNSFIAWLTALNHQMNYFFISQKSELKVTLLIKLFLYATAILLPMRSAISGYFEKDIAFSVVSLAAYTLIVVVIILFFFNKEDILRLLSSENRFVVWLRVRVDRFYYPVFSFLMLLLILSNPYIGYSNLAWYLSFAIPVSLAAIYGLFLVHYFVRRYSLFFFIKEEDDEVVSKFEHAKAYYGFFVAISFMLLACGAFVLLARLWGFEGYTLNSLWKSLSDDWVITIPTGGKLGFVELIKFGMFIAGGLVISSLIKKFILVRLFDIFRTEPGVQNTASKISHYFIIILAVILGFTAINLSQYALTAGGLLLAGVVFGLKDQIADYFAGVMVLLERPVEIGHYVETGEHAGKVHRMSARSTTLKTARNLLIIIPNRDLISKPIINWGQGRYAVGCELKILVSFKSDPEKVRSLLHEIMKEHSLVLRVPSPVVRLEGFEESALYFYCRCYVSSRKLMDMWDLQSDLRTSIIKKFRENNIEIPFPQRVVHFVDGKDKKGLPSGNPIEVSFDKK